MQWLIVGIIIIMYCIEVLTGILNYRHRNAPLPSNVQGLYDTAQYDKWLEYSMWNFKFSLIQKTLNVAVLLMLLISGAFGMIESFIPPQPNAIVHSVVFLALYGVIRLIISIPFDYYATFVIEEAFGFNKMTIATFFKDILKSVLLSVVVGGVIIIALNGLYLWFAQSIVWFALGAFALITVVMVALFMLNGVLVRAFNTLNPLEEGALKTEIEALAKRLGFSIKKVYVMDASKRSSKLNAFFTGLGKTREVVLFDTLVDRMDSPQILGVLAHELGHATYKDTWRMLGLQIVHIGVFTTILGWTLSTPSLHEAFGLNGVNFAFALVLFGVLVRPVNLFLSLGSNAHSRIAEYRADAFAVEHTSANSLGDALKTLSVENFANLTPHPLYVLLHYSHPPIDQRLRAIGFDK